MMKMDVQDIVVDVPDVEIQMKKKRICNQIKIDKIYIMLYNKRSELKQQAAIFSLRLVGE